MSKSLAATAYRRDDQGQWWYYRKDGTRYRCKQKICEFCGIEYPSDPFHAATRKYCSQNCSAAANAAAKGGLTGASAIRWKGGTRVTKHGYVEVWQPPGKSGRRRYVNEHRLVMEQVLGRPLTSTERVHHKNGVRHDNRPENLELWEFGHPHGQRKAERGKPCPHCNGTGVIGG